MHAILLCYPIPCSLQAHCQYLPPCSLHGAVHGIAHRVRALGCHVFCIKSCRLKLLAVPRLTGLYECLTCLLCCPAAAALPPSAGPFCLPLLLRRLPCLLSLSLSLLVSLLLLPLVLKLLPSPPLPLVLLLLPEVDLRLCLRLCLLRVRLLLRCLRRCFSRCRARRRRMRMKHHSTQANSSSTSPISSTQNILVCVKPVVPLGVPAEERP